MVSPWRCCNVSEDDVVEPAGSPAREEGAVPPPDHDTATCGCCPHVGRKRSRDEAGPSTSPSQAAGPSTARASGAQGGPSRAVPPPGAQAAAAPAAVPPVRTQGQRRRRRLRPTRLPPVAPGPQAPAAPPPAPVRWGEQGPGLEHLRDPTSEDVNYGHRRWPILNEPNTFLTDMMQYVYPGSHPERNWKKDDYLAERARRLVNEFNQTGLPQTVHADIRHEDFNPPPDVGPVLNPSWRCSCWRHLLGENWFNDTDASIVNRLGPGWHDDQAILIHLLKRLIAGLTLSYRKTNLFQERNPWQKRRRMYERWSEENLNIFVKMLDTKGKDEFDGKNWNLEKTERQEVAELTGLSAEGVTNRLIWHRKVRRRAEKKVVDTNAALGLPRIPQYKLRKFTPKEMLFWDDYLLPNRLLNPRFTFSDVEQYMIDEFLDNVSEVPREDRYVMKKIRLYVYNVTQRKQSRRGNRMRQNVYAYYNILARGFNAPPFNVQHPSENRREWVIEACRQVIQIERERCRQLDAGERVATDQELREESFEERELEDDAYAQQLEAEVDQPAQQQQPQEFDFDEFAKDLEAELAEGEEPDPIARELEAELEAEAEREEQDEFARELEAELEGEAEREERDADRRRIEASPGPRVRTPSPNKAIAVSPHRPESPVPEQPLQWWKDDGQGGQMDFVGEGSPQQHLQQQNLQDLVNLAGQDSDVITDEFYALLNPGPYGTALQQQAQSPGQKAAVSPLAGVSGHPDLQIDITMEELQEIFFPAVAFDHVTPETERPIAGEPIFDITPESPTGRGKRPAHVEDGGASISRSGLPSRAAVAPGRPTAPVGPGGASTSRPRSPPPPEYISPSSQVDRIRSPSPSIARRLEFEEGPEIRPASPDPRDPSLPGPPGVAGELYEYKPESPERRSAPGMSIPQWGPAGLQWAPPGPHWAVDEPRLEHLRSPRDRWVNYGHRVWPIKDQKENFLNGMMAFLWPGRWPHRTWGRDPTNSERVRRLVLEFNQHGLPQTVHADIRHEVLNPPPELGVLNPSWRCKCWRRLLGENWFNDTDSSLFKLLGPQWWDDSEVLLHLLKRLVTAMVLHYTTVTREIFFQSYPPAAKLKVLQFRWSEESERFLRKMLEKRGTGKNDSGNYGRNWDLDHPWRKLVSELTGMNLEAIDKKLSNARRNKRQPILYKDHPSPNPLNAIRLYFQGTRVKGFDPEEQLFWDTYLLPNRLREPWYHWEYVTAEIKDRFINEVSKSRRKDPHIEMKMKNYVAHYMLNDATRKGYKQRQKAINVYNTIAETHGQPLYCQYHILPNGKWRMADNNQEWIQQAANQVLEIYRQEIRDTREGRRPRNDQELREDDLLTESLRDAMETGVPPPPVPHDEEAGPVDGSPGPVVRSPDRLPVIVIPPRFERPEEQPADQVQLDPVPGPGDPQDELVDVPMTDVPGRTPVNDPVENVVPQVESDSGQESGGGGSSDFIVPDFTTTPTRVPVELEIFPELRDPVPGPGDPQDELVDVPMTDVPGRTPVNEPVENVVPQVEADSGQESGGGGSSDFIVPDFTTTPTRVPVELEIFPELRDPVPGPGDPQDELVDVPMTDVPGRTPVNEPVENVVPQVEADSGQESGGSGSSDFIVPDFTTTPTRVPVELEIFPELRDREASPSRRSGGSGGRAPRSPSPGVQPPAGSPPDINPPSEPDANPNDSEGTRGSEGWADGVQQPGVQPPAGSPPDIDISFDDIVVPEPAAFPGVSEESGGPHARPARIPSPGNDVQLPAGSQSRESRNRNPAPGGHARAEGRRQQERARAPHPQGSSSGSAATSRSPASRSPARSPSPASGSPARSPSPASGARGRSPSRSGSATSTARKRPARQIPALPGSPGHSDSSNLRELLREGGAEGLDLNDPGLRGQPVPNDGDDSDMPDIPYPRHGPDVPRSPDAEAVPMDTEQLINDSPNQFLRSNTPSDQKSSSGLLGGSPGQTSSPQIPGGQRPRSPTPEIELVEGTHIARTESPRTGLLRPASPNNSPPHQ